MEMRMESLEYVIRNSDIRSLTVEEIAERIYNYENRQQAGVEKSSRRLKEINEKIKQFGLIAKFTWREPERFEPENIKDFQITDNNINFRTFDYGCFVLVSNGYYLKDIEKMYKVAKQLASVGLLRKGK